MTNTLPNTRLKEETKTAHQALEKKVILQLKAIRSEADYASFIHAFYLYFNALESKLAVYINDTIVPDLSSRRNSSYLKADLQALGFKDEQERKIALPEINSLAQALGAMYVMEGSIMGGPIIVEMLRKHGLAKGFSFFSGYGAETGTMWNNFVTVLNERLQNTTAQEESIKAASETFEKFQFVFEA